MSKKSYSFRIEDHDLDKYEMIISHFLHTLTFNQLWFEDQSLWYIYVIWTHNWKKSLTQIYINIHYPLHNKFFLHCIIVSLLLCPMISTLPWLSWPSLVSTTNARSQSWPALLIDGLCSYLFFIVMPDDLLHTSTIFLTIFLTSWIYLD